MDFLLYLSVMIGLGFTAHVLWHRTAVPLVRMLVITLAPVSIAGLALTSIAADRLGRERAGITGVGLMEPVGTGLLALAGVLYAVAIALHVRTRL